MITAIPNGWFSSDYAIQRAGVTLGDLDCSRAMVRRIDVAAERAVVFDLEGLDYHLFGEVPAAGISLVNLRRLVLEQDGRTIAWAEPATFFHFFTVHWADRQFDLKGNLWSWGTKLQVIEGGVEAGMIYRGYLSRTTVIEPLGELTAAVQTFMIWLALSVWKRAWASSGGD